MVVIVLCKIGDEKSIIGYHILQSVEESNRLLDLSEKNAKTELDAEENPIVATAIAKKHGETVEKQLGRGRELHEEAFRLIKELMRFRSKMSMTLVVALAFAIASLGAYAFDSIASVRSEESSTGQSAAAGKLGGRGAAEAAAEIKPKAENEGDDTSP